MATTTTTTTNGFAAAATLPTCTTYIIIIYRVSRRICHFIHVHTISIKYTIYRANYIGTPLSTLVPYNRLKFNNQKSQYYI